MMVRCRAGAEISQASTRIGVNIQFGEMEPRRREEVEPECQYLDCTLQEFKPGNNKRRTFNRPHQVHQICCIGKKRHTETARPHPGISQGMYSVERELSFISSFDDNCSLRSISESAMQSPVAYDATSERQPDSDATRDRKKICCSL